MRDIYVGPTLLVLVILAGACGCGHAGGPVRLASVRRMELSQELLSIEFDKEGLRQELQSSSIRGRANRLEQVEKLSQHIAFVAELLKRSGEEASMEARVGYNLAALSLSLIRIDWEATVRGIGGVARTKCNSG